MCLDAVRRAVALTDVVTASQAAVSGAELDAIVAVAGKRLAASGRCSVTPPRRLRPEAEAAFRDRVSNTPLAARWQRALEQQPCAETALFGAPDPVPAPRQLAVARAALIAVGASPLRALDGVWIETWWTNEPGILRHVRDQVAERCPTNDATVAAIARAHKWPRELPIHTYLDVREAWLARGARDGTWRRRPLLRHLRELMASASHRTVDIMLARRSATLSAIGFEYGISGERVRQIERRGRQCLDEALARAPADTRARIVNAMNCAAVHEETLWRAVAAPEPNADLVFGRLVLEHLGGAQVRTYGRETMHGWWSLDETRASQLITSVVAAIVPASWQTIVRAAHDAGVAADFPLAQFLGDANSPFERDARADVWVRRDDAGGRVKLLPVRTE